MAKKAKRKYSKGAAKKVERAMKKRKSGTLRSGRSTSAVPTNPVLPVMAMRLPARFSLITGILSTIW